MFEYACGDSTGCAAMMIAAGVLGALAAVCWLVITVQAFRSQTVQGVLCLVIPPYALYYGLAKLEHRRKRMLVTGLVLGPILAFVAANSATAVFGPDVSAESPEAFDEDFGDDPLGEPGADPGSGDDLGEFEEDLDDLDP